MSDQQQTGPEPETKHYENLEAYAKEAEGTGEYIPGTGEPEPGPEDMSLGGEELAFIFSVGFDLLAARRGDHWKLKFDEAEKLGFATDKVLEKYFPDIQTGPEVTLLLTAGMFVAPRLMIDRDIAEKKTEQEPATEGGDDGDES